MGFYELFWYFSIYAVLGWCLEVCFCTVNTGSFVNRGFLSGPVCPIYGFGMVIILAVLLPVQHNFLLLFAGAVVLTSALELVTGFVLKKALHTSWWDYSDLPFNLGGYICLKFSLAWGVCAVAVVRGLHPLVAALVSVVPRGLGWALMPAVAAVFLADGAVTLTAILHLNRDLGRIAQLTEALHAGSDALARTLGNGALAVDEKLDDAKLELLVRADLARADWLDKKHTVRRRLLRAFPHMKHTQPQALQALRELYRSRRKP